MTYLTADEIKNFQPFPLFKPADEAKALNRAKERMQKAEVWNEAQTMGRRYPIGCVALEITQRCNLDCTLCYLSEHSESVKDIPMSEIFRRIEQIKFHYGKGTDVQITGGDPTLREESELLTIVRKVKSIGMRPTLMTNGIKATRRLMLKLIDAGLNDIAIHVDLTQERKDYNTEVELNKVREKYIDRVRGLPIAVIFNTTVFKDNIQEIPDLIKFFRKHADVVGMASFQLQADTGRGLLRKRAELINLQTVSEKIQEGADTKISFDTVQIGHSDCHRYGSTLVVNGNTYDLFDSKKLTRKMLQKLASVNFDRRFPHKVALTLLKFFLTNPSTIVPVFSNLFIRFLKLSFDWVRGGFKIYKQAYFMQNFMDAKELDGNRIDACSFMVMTPDGPISMCMHNAKRDDYILKPFKVKTDQGETLWNPLQGNANIPNGFVAQNKKVNEA